eukprot:scaffold157837_cov41-Prasinocladus_malaysianus.AAC.2
MYDVIHASDVFKAVCQARRVSYCRTSIAYVPRKLVLMRPPPMPVKQFAAAQKYALPAVKLAWMLFYLIVAVFCHGWAFCRKRVSATVAARRPPSCMPI